MAPADRVRPRTQIVASALVRDAAELVELSRRAQPFADLFELRADEWRGTRDELAAAIAHCELPVVVAARPRFEGGTFAGSEEQRRALLAVASKHARFVDVESRASFVGESFAPARKVVSLHDFAATPSDTNLTQRIAELRRVDCNASRTADRELAFVKLAVTPTKLIDVARLVRLARADEQAARASTSRDDAPVPLVAIAMGELGLPTRLLAGKLGAPWVYGSVPGATPTAPGQVDVRDLAEVFRVREQSETTCVCAIVGDPIAHSLSPRLHNALDRAAAMDRVFVPIRASSLDDALALADELEVEGLSVTLPLKESAARAAVGAPGRFPWPPPEGAVNTLLRSARGWLAANTDRIGFEHALTDAAPELLVPTKRVLVLGAGGAARTVVAACTARRMNVTIASRTHARAESLAATFGAETRRLETLDAATVASFDLVVNATPVGMQRQDESTSSSPLPTGSLRRGQVVFDLVYRPRRTRLIEEAHQAGARTIEGLEMFVAQALAQFELFTGVPADPIVARSVVEQALT